jgi:Carboxypeptidase regulatory-like domain
MFRLLIASLLSVTAIQAQLATAVGVVVDSVRGRPLVGATVIVSGADPQGITDSSGRFRIDSIPPGDHTMGVLHPFLDELGIGLTTNKITFAPGATMAVVLATPSAQHWIGPGCSDADRQEGADAVMGHVLQLAADEPVTGALLHYTGTVLVVSKDVGLRHTTITRDASVNATGFFLVCGVPAGAIGVIRAAKGRVSTGDVPVDLSNGPLAIVTLRLAPNDTLPTHAGVVTGRIVDNKGAPVPAARVTLRGGQESTQATDSGTFRLTGLPLGSQTIDIDKLGFPKQSTVVNVIGPDQPAVVAIALLAPPPRSTEAQLVSVGFVRRRLAGGGVFVTSDTIAKLKARNVADLQPLFPATILRPTRDGPILVPTTASAARCIFYLVDGSPYQWIGPQSFNRDVPASSVVGIEYYQFGHVPQELSSRMIVRGFPRCSMLAIWTVNSVGVPPAP